MDLRNKRGAEINSSQYLLISNLRIKLKKVTEKFNQKSRTHDVRRLKDKEVKETFQLKL
jgi:hypothetical protein